MVEERMATAQETRMASRAAAAAMGLNILLCLLNFGLAYASGSLAVAAELTHNLVDLAASVAVLIGVRISERKSRAFPYGLYKVENLVAVGVSILIFVTAYEIAREALFAAAQPTVVTPLILGGVALSALLPLTFSVYEMRVGRRLNSPSLMADAQEFRAHVLSSGIVFLALVGHHLGFPFDRWAALAVVAFVAKTGWDLLLGGMRVLLDASLPAQILAQVRAIILADPAVAGVHTVMGRNTGRYRFLEAEVNLRVSDLEKAHAARTRLEASIRAQVAHVERVKLHCEPQVRTHVRLAVPLADAAGNVSDHFGEAPYFGLVTVRVSNGQVEHQEVVANPHLEEQKAKGLRVGEWLVGLKTDVVVVREIQPHRGPAYLFRDAGVEVRPGSGSVLAEVVAQQPETADGPT